MNRRSPSITSLLAFGLIALPLIYVLSYAPGTKLYERGPFASTPRGSIYPAYKPVDWLMHNTPLREPLFCWAGLWGVREDFEIRLYGPVAPSFSINAEDEWTKERILLP